MLDVREDFPILAQRPELVYLDSAATTLVPKQVIGSLREYYESIAASPYRGANQLARAAERLIEDARATVARFIGAYRSEIVFVRNTTEAINLLVCCLGSNFSGQVVVSSASHNSNLLPWMRLAPTVVPPKPGGEIDIARTIDAITDKTLLVAVGHASNVTGAIADLDALIEEAHRRGCLVFVDAAQTAPYGLIDVRRLQCDFLAFSGHKMLGPKGIGVFFCNNEQVNKLAPYHLGGGVVESVTENGSSYTLLPPPWRFEAGTPDVAGIHALASAVSYLLDLDLDLMRQHAEELASYLHHSLEQLPGICVIGRNDSGTLPVRSFVPEVESVPLDVVADLLDQEDIIVRSGSLCAHSVLSHLGQKNGVIRASCFVYNTTGCIDRLIARITEIQAMLCGA